MRAKQFCARLEVYLTTHIALELLHIEDLGRQVLHALVIPCAVVLLVAVAKATLAIMLLRVIAVVELAITHQHIVIDILRWLAVVSL